MHLESCPYNFWGPLPGCPRAGQRMPPFPASVWVPKELASWPGPDQAFLSPHRLWGCPLALGGFLCSLASPELVSLLRLMGLGQVWMGRALIHGLENPSLVICQLSPRPEPVAGPPTSLSNLGLGALKGPCPFIVCETPRVILKPSPGLPCTCPGQVWP